MERILLNYIKTGIIVNGFCRVKFNKRYSDEFLLLEIMWITFM
tara:strand:+ start:379 stop:507 length:129 start_codon:yes stop_codon:yes gene_type:complete